MKARILLLAIVLLCEVVYAQKGWKDLFNGKDLKGWKQLNGEAKYTVDNGELVGTTVSSKVNSFLVTEETFGDFVLEMDFKMDSTNSGVQVRSESKADFQNGRVHGYQVDFDPTPRAWTGGIYDEARRGWVYPLIYNPGGGKGFKPREWNRLKIECVGASIRAWINGTPTASIVDSKTPKGFIALQVHGVYRPEDVGKQIRWKNIRIQTSGIKPSPKDEIFVADLDAAARAVKEGKGFEVKEIPAEKRVEVYHNNKFITAYIYPDSVMKPVLYPIKTTSGITITREYPLVIKAGERADHPHHVGLFLTHQSVNGLDFWNMSTNIKPANRNKYGKIDHARTVVAQGLKDQAYLTAQASWKSTTGEQHLEELTTFRFTVVNGDVVIDRTSELRASRDVVFKDMKDAFLGLRLARELEQPSDQKDRMVLADGSLTEPMPTKDGVTGQYRNSESQIGDDIWGKRAAWACMDGKKDGKGITIAIIDHPQNLEYPTYWHARGYGLFAANPLGKEVFSETKTPLNLTLKKSEAITFRYRIIIHEGEPLTPAYLNNSQKEWVERDR